MLLFDLIVIVFSASVVYFLFLPFLLLSFAFFSAVTLVALIVKAFNVVPAVVLWVVVIVLVSTLVVDLVTIVVTELSFQLLLLLSKLLLLSLMLFLFLLLIVVRCMMSLTLAFLC